MRQDHAEAAATVRILRNPRPRAWKEKCGRRPHIHHPLRHIKTRPGKIRVTVHIDHAANWAAVDLPSEVAAEDVP